MLGGSGVRNIDSGVQEANNGISEANAKLDQLLSAPPTNSCTISNEELLKLDPLEQKKYWNIQREECIHGVQKAKQQEFEKKSKCRYSNQAGHGPFSSCHLVELKNRILNSHGTSSQYPWVFHGCSSSLPIRHQSNCRRSWRLQS